MDVGLHGLRSTPSLYQRYTVMDGLLYSSQLYLQQFPEISHSLIMFHTYSPLFTLRKNSNKKNLKKLNQ